MKNSTSKRKAKRAEAPKAPVSELRLVETEDAPMSTSRWLRIEGDGLHERASEVSEGLDAIEEALLAVDNWANGKDQCSRDLRAAIETIEKAIGHLRWTRKWIGRTGSGLHDKAAEIDPSGAEGGAS